MARMWNTRLSWSGEVPANLTDLNPVALTRADQDEGRKYFDAVNSSRRWEHITKGSGAAYASGLYGNSFLLNSTNPATQQESMRLPYFKGLWPSKGKVLIGLWVDQNFTMSFTPMINTRMTDPFVYLSSASSQRPRHQVYSAKGDLILDQYETVPWQASGDWIWYGQLVDLDKGTSQIGSVDYVGKQTFLSPERELSGAPNTSCTASVEMFGHTGYWTSGWADEVLIAHPTSAFDFGEFLDALAQGSRANGQTGDNRTRFTVTDSGITARSSQTLSTGAERVSWTRRPNVTAPSGSTAYYSSDDGKTWKTSSPSALPAPFTGLLRWTVPLGTGQSFNGIDLEEPTLPPPTLNPITDVTLEQNETATRTLRYTVAAGGTWSISGASTVEITKTGNTLTIEAGFALGTDIVTVTLTDSEGQSVTRTFTVTVTPQQVTPSSPPIYPHAPIILWNAKEPWDVLAEPLSGVITKEVDGEETLKFTFQPGDPRYDVIQAERNVTCAGETYRVRRITDRHQGGKLIREVYCEAKFYDLATGPQIDGREWTQVVAGDVMRQALRGTGWRVAVANVSTLRTYETEDMSPLELLREVKRQHGGHLVFDNENETVSLLSSAGRDQGVTFFYGFGLSGAAKVEDTTSLVTRIYAKNADGVTIASVNNGLPYVQDLSYTDEVKMATYDFAAGTSPYTMLNMAKVTLANRAYPDYSYEVNVSDLSAESGQTIDRFELRDWVRVVDEDLDLNETQQIVHMEYDVVRPWDSKLTLSGKLRESGSSEGTDAGVLTTGSTQGTFDLVPYNLLLNGRFDQGLAHWARFGAVARENKQGTGDWSAVFEGSGERWIEQTVQVDNRDGFTLSFDIESMGFPSGATPNVTATATIIFEDGTSDEIDLELS